MYESLNSFTDFANFKRPSAVEKASEQGSQPPHPPRDKIILSCGFFALSETKCLIVLESLSESTVNFPSFKWQKLKMIWFNLLTSYLSISSESPV
ncbi:hypothetical protein D3C85_1734860 [compost metagenome]